MVAGRQDDVALGFDLLATIPVSWTLGVYVALRFGNGVTTIGPVQQILSMPPICAGALALLLNALHLPPPSLAMEAIEGLAQSAVALMLFSLGLALEFRSHAAWRWIALPVAVRIGGGLLVGLLFGAFAGLPPEDHRALIAVSAAPAFMMGVVFCDRFGLDTAAFALTMSVGVIVYLALLPPLIAALPV